MAIILKFLVLLGGITGTAVGLCMLLFLDKFMAFNDYINKNFLVGSKYEYSAFGMDNWLFGKSYIMAVALLIIGLALLTQFLRYAPY